VYKNTSKKIKTINYNPLNKCLNIIPKSPCRWTIFGSYKFRVRISNLSKHGKEIFLVCSCVETESGYVRRTYIEVMNPAMYSPVRKYGRQMNGSYNRFLPIGLWQFWYHIHKHPSIGACPLPKLPLENNVLHSSPA
jgi:hypothetical protein